MRICDIDIRTKVTEQLSTLYIQHVDNFKGRQCRNRIVGTMYYNGTVYGTVLWNNI
jgi:hypothetical protein